MALIHQLRNLIHYPDIFFSVRREVDKHRMEEIAAAIKLQSWFRATKTRKSVQFLNDSAAIIQKEFRAFVTRKRYRILVSDRLKKLMQQHYDQEATKIQSIWRGFATRKFISDYYSQKTFLAGLKIKNEQTLDLLRDHEGICKRKAAEQRHQKEAAANLYGLRKTHYLLSTQVRDGVFNAKVKPCPLVEAALKEATPLSSAEREHIDTVNREKRLRSAVGIPMAEQKNEASDGTEKIFKLTIKPQGPFRNPDEVRQQRLKAARPSLRVGTDYESADVARSQMHRNEWTKRVIDVKFIPWRKPDKQIKGPTLRTDSCYKDLHYGFKHFRDRVERGSEIHHIKPFHTVLPPIPLFDQFGKTY